jgi:hypothetical protein
MARFHVVVVEPSDDEEVMTTTLVVTANRLDYDENGVLEMWKGPAEGERLVAVFSPQAWLRAYDTTQVSEHEPPEE